MGLANFLLGVLVALFISYFFHPCLDSGETHSITERPPPDGYPYFRNAQGLWLFHREWRPTTTELRGVAYVFHGLGEYSGRHHDLANRLAEAGFVVYALDHQGHGKSQGVRAHVEHFDDYVTDVLQFVQLTSPSHPPSLPRIIVGHSMGGLIAVRTALRKPNFFSGLILSAPALKSPYDSPLLYAITKLLSSWCSQLSIELIKINSHHLSRDQEIVRERNGNALNYIGGLRVGFGYQIHWAMRETLESVPQLQTPFIILHGSEDHVTTVSGSEIMNRTAGSKDKTLKIYPKLFHEVFLEPEKEVVFSDVFQWLNERV